MKYLALVGPTASGKSDRAVELAERLGWPVLSFDSRQFYRELPIGTAAPGSELRNRVPHFFVLDRGIECPLSAGAYGAEVRQWVFEHPVEGVVLVGGSGLYLEALMRGFDAPAAVDSKLREELNAQYALHGIEFLRKSLERENPTALERIDPHNPQRLLRALEVARTPVAPNPERTSGLAGSWKVLGMEVERTELIRRIEARSQAMIETGLIDEARSVLEYRHLPVLRTIGYPEAFAVLEGRMSEAECAALIALKTRQYAKRQRTWFRNRTPGVQWLTASDAQGWDRALESWLG